jgi:hypothetical protein
MKWLERVREKNSLPTPLPLTKLTKVSAALTELPFVSFVSASPGGSEVFADPQAEVIKVPYQRIFSDWDLADGTYTPEQLRKAKMVVKPWGPVQSYTLTASGAVELPN